MDQSITQALHSLLPSLIGPLPPDLIELAGSLHAQSRSKASSLKADEEIARSYACANLACVRLKSSLTLPKIEPRPPCSPRVYQKLYKYLDDVLSVVQRKQSRYSKSKGDISGRAHIPPTRRTQSREILPETKNWARKQAATAENIPSWIMPFIRQLCKELKAPAAPHHVFAGVSSICSSINLHSRSMTNIRDVKLPALVIAVFLVVYTRLAGVEMPSSEYLHRSHLALTVVRDSLKGDVDIENVRDDDINRCVRRIGEQGWTRMDWFENIPTGSGLEECAIRIKSGEQIEADTEIVDELLSFNKRSKAQYLSAPEENHLQPGLGTMMQDNTDYLSDERRLDYQQWKSHILAEVERLENQEFSSQAMTR